MVRDLLFCDSWFKYICGTANGERYCFVIHGLNIYVALQMVRDLLFCDSRFKYIVAL